jgi:hypothetical protein
MTWERTRAGLVSGVVSFAPLVLVLLGTGLGVVTGAGAVTLALLAFSVSIVLGGALAGYLAGQGKRRRSEAKAVVGGAAGVIAGAIFGAGLETLYLMRSTGGQGDALAIHPIRVFFAIVLMSALLVSVAMLAAQLTAKPLPPPRRTRRLTAQMPAVPPPAPRDAGSKTPAR